MTAYTDKINTFFYYLFEPGSYPFKKWKVTQRECHDSEREY